MSISVPTVEEMEAEFEKENSEYHQCYCIALVSISETECQCMDCLKITPKYKGFVSDFPEYDRG